LGDQVIEEETGGACGTFKGEDKCIQGFSAEHLKDCARFEDAGVGGRRIKKKILKTSDGKV
jgi:hypothetical protein